MKPLRDIFPKASKSFLDVNTAILTPKEIKNDTTGMLEGYKRGSRKLLNRTETEFALRLEAMKRAGEILRYEFEGITLRWFDMRYTPDFVVFGDTKEIANDGSITFSGPARPKFIEVKGPHIHYRQQALARFKGARGFWPEFSFELWQRQKEGWKQII